MKSHQMQINRAFAEAAAARVRQARPPGACQQRPEEDHRCPHFLHQRRRNFRPVCGVCIDDQGISLALYLTAEALQDGKRRIRVGNLRAVVQHAGSPADECCR